MGKRGIVFVSTIALIMLCGCATHQSTNAVARAAEPDVGTPGLPASLVGTWSGSFWPVGADAGGRGATGTVTLAIKDDGTYTLITHGGVATNDTGVAVANGRAVTLQSSSGRSLWLTRRGDVLYGVTPGRLSGYMVQISVGSETDAGASGDARQLASRSVPLGSRRHASAGTAGRRTRQLPPRHESAVEAVWRLAMRGCRHGRWRQLRTSRRARTGAHAGEVACGLVPARRRPGTCYHSRAGAPRRSSASRARPADERPSVTRPPRSGEEES